jgi:hypothetical protein
MSFLNSRPSHIQADNHSISVPDDIVGVPPTSNSIHSPDNARSPQSFILLCRLSLLCSRLQSQVCTLASSLLLPAERLAKVKSIEEDTQMLLAEVQRDETGRASSSGVGRCSFYSNSRIDESDLSSFLINMPFGFSLYAAKNFHRVKHWPRQPVSIVQMFATAPDQCST